MARTIADAFNQYHNDYVKPQLDSKISAAVASDTFATKAALDDYAPIDSPNFTGVPTAPTADNDTDSTQLATTEFCQNLIRRLVGTAPETLNTLVELATAVNNDPDFAQTIIRALDNKLNKTDAANIYLAKTANAVSASRDELGNVIHSTYATKSDLSGVSVADANSAVKGVMKLYTSTGSSTDGTMTRDAITTALSTKLGVSATAVAASKVTGGTVTLTGAVTGSASFNSSGNVSVTTSPAFNKIFTSTDQASSLDLNNLTDLGFHRIAVNSSTSHAMSYTGTIYILVIGGASRTSRIQLAFNYAGQRMWMRGSENATTGGSWSAWRKIDLELDS